MKFSRSILSLILVAGLAALITGCIDQNTRPVASFIADPTSGPSPLAVDFDASGSYDPDGTIVSYSWNFGDGTSGTGITTTHTFTCSSDCTYTVRLTVTDDAGKSATTSATISVTGSGGGATLFFDDFEDGFDPAWQSSTYWDVIDGVFYGAGAGCVYAYVTTGVDWDDYVVEMDLTMVDSSVGVLVRCQSDLQSYVVLQGDYSSLEWRVYEDGTMVDSSSKTETGFFTGSQKVKIVVEGSTYSCYTNDLLRSTFVDTRFVKGMPGLMSCIWFYRGPEYCSKFDNFKVTALE